MSFVQREHDRLDDEFRKMAEVDPRREALRAARQALAWALEPEGYKAPLLSIMGNHLGLEDCLAHNRPPSS